MLEHPRPPCSAQPVQEETRSDQRIVQSAMDVKTWAARQPSCSAVRPSKCTACSAASRPAGSALVIVGHGLRARTLEGPPAPGQAPALTEVVARRYRCRACHGDPGGRAHGRRARLSLLPQCDCLGPVAVGLRARACSIGAGADEHGEDRGRIVSDALGVTAALDSLCADALRNRDRRAGHAARACGGDRDICGRARTDFAGPGVARCVLRSGVVRVRLSDVDVGPKACTALSTTAGSWRVSSFLCTRPAVGGHSGMRPSK